MLILLMLFGLCAGSFADALAWRLHSGQNYLTGRSQCDSCGHKLSFLDLVPILGWAIQRGRCRYCGAKITSLHPLVELASGLIFGLSYIYWPFSLSASGQKELFISWLAVSAGLIALSIYDARWMLLPNKIIYPTLLVAVVGRASYVLVSNDGSVAHQVLIWASSVLVASGIFWALFMVSHGKWIGYGDVRLGLITGTLIADPIKSFLMVFIASLLGSIAAGLLVVFKKQAIGARIAYGPFLVMATFIVILFGQSMIDWYNHIFLG